MPALLIPFLLAALAGIAWQESLDAALEKARAENKVVFVAVNMDGERANDTLANTVYKDKDIVKLAGLTANLLASKETHAGGERECPRFGGVSCAVHQAVDKQVRKRVVKEAANGWVIAPQHVFLDASGAVILSVPYAVTKSELTWCFLMAIGSVDPEFKTRGGRAPKRLILKGVIDPGAGDAGSLNREQALQLLEEAKTTSRDNVHLLFLRLITADEPEAIAFAKIQFGSRWMRRDGSQTLAECIRAVGEASPPSYYEVILPLAKDGEPKIRAEAAVALEQLGSPKALKEVLEAYKKEKEAAVAKEWLRAAGALGAEDDKARKTVLKAARDDGPKEVLLRKNALIAAGSLQMDDEIEDLLSQALGDASGGVRRAAACAAAISREPRFVAALEAARDAEADDAVKKTFEVALAVLSGSGAQKDLGAQVAEVGEDEIPRQRLFGG
ncbi:MAG: HEAT repeat domain-containing protein [Planctomycetes bacterium]|nr:HEAT repeat domain-containing protein [Planctomycetota bacterium]